MQDDRPLSPRMRSPAGKATDPHPSGTAPDDANGARKGKKAQVKLLSPSRSKVSPKGKATSSVCKRKISSGSCGPAAKDASRTTSSSPPPSGNEIQSSPEASKGKAVRVRSASNDSVAFENSKRRSLSAESAVKIKNTNISKIIEQVIEAGKVISSKKGSAAPPQTATPKKERGRPPKKVKVDTTDTIKFSESSSQSTSSEKIFPRKYSSSLKKSPKALNLNKSPNKDRNKSTSVSPRRLKKAVEIQIKKESNVAESDDGPEDTKYKSLLQERVAKSIERVLTAINRDDYNSVFTNVKAKDTFKNFKKPKNHIKKKLKEKSVNLKTEESESELTEVRGRWSTPNENVSGKVENESVFVDERPVSQRKRGRPKGSKNKVKWDEHGNKVISKSLKKLLKKTLSAENNVPKPSITKMEVKNMPIKKRDYNHFLLSSAEDEMDSSCEKKKPLKVKGNKLNKRLNSKPSKVISSVVNKNKVVKLKRRLKPEIKTKKKKASKIKSYFTSSDSDGNEERKPSVASTPNKGRFLKSKAFSSDSEQESDTKYNITPRKKLVAKTIKHSKKAVKGKDVAKVKPIEKANKVKSVTAKKEIMSDSMSGSDMEDRPIKPPKKALKDKWNREEKRSSRASKAEVKVEDNEKKSPAKTTSITREKQNRMYYFEFDDTDVEAETSEDDDDDDELYVSKCTVKEIKRYKPSTNWKTKKSEMLSAPPKRAARMASLNAIAMMACMNEDAKVPLSSLSHCKESSMALVVKESTIARTHSDADDDSDSELEPPPLKRDNKRNSDHLANVIPKRKKRRGELDVQMDMKDMVVTKRMASLNASAIMAASFSLEPRNRKVAHISGGREVTNVDIKQEISYKSTKSQNSKTSRVITVEETTKKVKKAQCSRGTELEEHIIVKKRVKRQREIEVTDDVSDRDNGNVSDNIELDHEILPKAPDDSGMIVESTITYVSTQTHTAPQSVTLSGVSKYCISSTDGKTTTVVQQVQRKSTTTTNGVAPPTSSPTIPTSLIPPTKHVQVTQSESTRQNPRTTPNYSPLGALEVMQPTMHPPPPHHPPPSHFLNYTPPHHHMQHGISVSPMHHSHHPHLHPPHIAHHHHIASAPYPPLSPHSPPYPPPPRTSTPSSSPVCSTTPPSTTAPSQPSPLSCHPSSPGGYKSSSPTKPNNSSNFHAQNKMPSPVDLQKPGGPSIPTSSPGPHFREERNRPHMASPNVHGLPNGPSERHHSAFTAPTPTHSPGYQPVSGPMPLGGVSSANGSYKPLQASPGSTPPYSSPSRLTTPPPASNKSYQPPNPEHYPPHPYQPYPYPPSSYDKYYHPSATAYHLYQPPYPGGQYLGEQGSPEYSFHPPPSGTVHYSQESYTSYTLCVPAPPPHGSQLPPHPQTLALPPPPTSNASPHHHQNTPYTTYQYTEFNPGYPYPPAGTIVRINFLGPPPNHACCPPNSKNGPSGSLTGGGKGPEGDSRGKNQIVNSGSCNNYQYYMSPHPSHPNQPSGYQNPVQAHNAMGQGPPKHYNYPQVESHREREHHNHQPTSVTSSSCNKINSSSEPNFASEGQNNSAETKLNSFASLPQRVNSKLPLTKNNEDIVSKSSPSAVVTSSFTATSSSLSTSTSISSSQSSTPLLSIVVTQPSFSTSIASISSSETSDDSKSSIEKKDDTQTTKHNSKPIASSACGKNEIAVPNGKSTLQITTWVVPQSASPVAPSSNSLSAATGVSPSHTMLFSPTSTTTSISLPHPYASTNSVMSTSAPVVTSLEKLPLDNSKPKTSILTTNCNDSSIVSDSELSCKESKTNSSLDSCNKDQTVKNISTTSQRTGGRHLLCQPLPLNHSKTTSVLAKVKPSIIKSHLPVKESSISAARNEEVKIADSAVKSSSKHLPTEREENSAEIKNLKADSDISKDDECPVVPRKRGRPPKLKEASSEIVKDGICRNGVASETKPFLKAPGDVYSREDKVPRKRMSLLKSSGAKNSLAVPNSNLKRSKSSPSQDIPILKSDLKPVGDLKMINVKTEVLGKIKTEKVSPKNVSLKESGRLKFVTGDEDHKSQSLQSKEFNATFMPPPLGFDCETQEAFEKKISKLKSEDLEIGDNERKIKQRKGNDSERPGSKSPPLDKNGKGSKVNIFKGPRVFKHCNRQVFNGVNSKVRRKASLLAYLKERNNESDTSVGDTESPPPTSPNKEGKLHPFVNYSPSPGALRGRRASGTGKGKQIRKLKPFHGWSWDGEAHEGKVWLRNDEENMVRTCYKAMKHKEGDMIRVRDCVLLRSGMKKTDLPYVAKVAALWEDPDTSDMMMSILWYYRPEHTECGRREEDLTDEIFASKHRDHLSVACIEDRCYVLTFNEYCRYRRLLRLFQEKVHPTSSPVPVADDGYFRKERQPPGCVVQDLLFFCRKVYDYRQKRILKNPC